MNRKYLSWLNDAKVTKYISTGIFPASGMVIGNFGIGVDIENIDRFRKLDAVNSSSFLKKVFTGKELDYCFSKRAAAPHLAVRFAGKEAVIKAISSMGKINPGYRDIEILNTENGVPEVKLTNKNLKKSQVNVSLSHCEGKAIAFAVVIEVNRSERS